MGLQLNFHDISDVLFGDVWFMELDDHRSLLEKIYAKNKNAVVLIVRNTEYGPGIPCPRYFSVPASFLGSPVVAVYGSFAYWKDNLECDWEEPNYDIYGVTIPEGVAIISHWLFDECPNLKEINLPKSLILK